MNAKCAYCKNFWGSSEEMEWDGYSLICKFCPERKIMSNIKITAEVDGKQVPLNTISTESFEAIKALEKSEEIPVPVARVGHYHGNPNDRRLFLKIGSQLREVITRQQNIKMVAITLTNGRINNMWSDINEDLNDLYENIKPL